jgi:hypothetical protein
MAASVPEDGTPRKHDGDVQVTADVPVPASAGPVKDGLGKVVTSAGQLQEKASGPSRILTNPVVVWLVVNGHGITAAWNWVASSAHEPAQKGE